MMENWQKHLILFGLLVVAALIMPIFVTGLSLVLSPFIDPIWIILVVFIVTVLIAYRNREDE